MCDVSDWDGGTSLHKEVLRRKLWDETLDRTKCTRGSSTLESSFVALSRTRGRYNDTMNNDALGHDSRLAENSKVR